MVVDSERHWKGIDQTFYAALIPGWTSERDGARLMGLGVKAGYDLLCEEYGLEMDLETYMQLQDSVVIQVYSSLCEPLPGLQGLLDLLKREKMHIGIASSSRRRWVQTALERHRLLSAFETVCVSEDVEFRTKPLPDVYLLAARLLNVAPERCIALEDSKNGIASAKAAGMTCIAIRTDMNKEQDLSAADHHIRSLSEIDAALLSSLSASFPAD